MFVSTHQIKATGTTGANLFEGDSLVVGPTAGKWVPVSSITTFGLVPRGTTAQRPGYNPEGGLRYNSTLSTLEFSTNAAWVPIPSAVVFRDQVYSSSTPYNSGDMLIMAGQIVVANSSIAAGVTPIWGTLGTASWRPLMVNASKFKGAYSAAVTYPAGDVVVDTTSMASSKMYISAVGSNLNKPLTNPAFWLPFVPGGTTDLSSLAGVVFTGATPTVAGVKGLVPAPAINQDKFFLAGSGAWTSFADMNITGFPSPYDSSKEYDTGSLAREGSVFFESGVDVPAFPGAGLAWMKSAAWSPVLTATTASNLSGLTIAYIGNYDPAHNYVRGNQAQYNGSLWRCVAQTGCVGVTPGTDPYSWSVEFPNQKGSDDLGSLGAHWRPPSYELWTGSGLNPVLTPVINGDWFVVDVDPTNTNGSGVISISSADVKRFRISAYGLATGDVNKTLIVRKHDLVDLISLDMNGDYVFEYVGSKWRLTRTDSATLS